MRYVASLLYCCELVYAHVVIAQRMRILQDADARAASFDLWAGHPIDYTWIPDKAQQAHMDATEAKKRKRESEHTVPRTESGVATVAGTIVATDSEPAADIDEAGTSSEDQND
jgi:hypothetical protein